MAKLHQSQAGLLLIRNKTQVMIPLHKEVTSLGRRLTDIILDDPKASGHHAEIRKDGASYRLVDMKSTNGTFLNRRRVDEMVLSDQDVIEIGMTTLCFFSDIRDFHGPVEELTGSVKVKPQSAAEEKSHATANITTNSKTLMQTPILIEVVEGPGQGKKHRFRKSHILIGREEGDLVILDPDMSRRHALIEVLSSNVIFIKDLESTNGTFVNDRLIQSQRLQDGDQIRMGNVTLLFKADKVSEGGQAQ